MSSSRLAPLLVVVAAMMGCAGNRPHIIVDPAEHVVVADPDTKEDLETRRLIAMASLEFNLTVDNTSGHERLTINLARGVPTTEIACDDQRIPASAAPETVFNRFPSPIVVEPGSTQTFRYGAGRTALSQVNGRSTICRFRFRYALDSSGRRLLISNLVTVRFR